MLGKIHEITGYDVPFRPEIIFLNFWPGLSIPKISKDLISVLLVAAKTAIALKWKANSVPKLALWFEKNWDVYVMEKVIDHLL